MSVLTAVFLNNLIVFATDTIYSDRKETINKNGKELKETIAGLCSKSIYYPHLQTSVSVLGATILSQEYYKFIEEDFDNRGICSFDELVSLTEKNFVKFIDKPKVKDFEKVDEPNTDFLGVIFLFGLSKIDENEKKVQLPRMQAFKLMVYKTHIVKDLLNPVSDEIMYYMHPPLPSDIADRVFNENENQPIDKLIINLIKEAKIIYDNSSREQTLVGGELNFTIMSCSQDVNDGRLSISQYTGYRFDDFDEIVDEMKAYNEKKKKQSKLYDLYEEGLKLINN